jgi:hypothetical protein
VVSTLFGLMWIRNEVERLKSKDWSQREIRVEWSQQKFLLLTLVGIEFSTSEVRSSSEESRKQSFGWIFAITFLHSQFPSEDNSTNIQGRQFSFCFVNSKSLCSNLCARDLQVETIAKLLETAL